MLSGARLSSGNTSSKAAELIEASVISSVVSYGLSFEQVINFVFGITAGEYDAVLVAWNIKVQ